MGQFASLGGWQQFDSFKGQLQISQLGKELSSLLIVVLGQDGGEAGNHKEMDLE